MTHVEEGLLQAFTDGELLPERRREVAHHLESCGVCRSDLAELEEAAAVFSGAVAGLDAAAPPLRAPAPAAPRRASRGSGLRAALPRAAVLVLGLAGAASAALPGSPVRDWVQRTLAPARAPVSTAPVAPVADVERAPEAGVSVAPLNGGVVVVLRDAGPELVVRARLTEGSRAGVYATGAAAGARFQTSTGRLQVTGASAGELLVELPRDAEQATVLVNGREYLHKQGDQLRLALPQQSRTAPEVSFRVRP